MKYFVYCRKSQEAEDRQVLSLESQEDEIARIVASSPDIDIIDTFTEAYSAKSPGRPLFDEMLRRIEAGDAEAILAWHPDRLARNSVDGGRIIHLLDRGTLKDLTFCSYSFENSSQGKFMLNIIFGYSKYYVDALSENVKRGMRTKLKNGWKPNIAPAGYKNCKETRTIVPDELHFRAIRNMFELLLAGKTVAEIHRIACDEWGYTMPVHKTQGGNKPVKSAIYKILSNPFYMGKIRWNGKLYDGKHLPLVSAGEFERAQTLLGRGKSKKPETPNFAYTGLMKCGVCGLAITAERKVKPSGREYVYYHCTRVHREPRCTQPSIELRPLEAQIIEWIERLHLPPRWLEVLKDFEKLAPNQFAADAKERAESHKRNALEIDRQLSNLTDLRLRDVVDDQEFMRRRQELQIQKAAELEKTAKVTDELFTLEPMQIVGKFFVQAKYWFPHASTELKRKLLKILCSNPTLTDKKVRLEARLPFLELGDLSRNLQLCGAGTSDRTKPVRTQAKEHKLKRQLKAFSDAEETKKLLIEIDRLQREYPCFAALSHLHTDKNPSGLKLPL